MFLIILVYIAALTLEVIGSYMSIVGLASNTVPIIIGLVITLDFAKVIIASVLYKNWHNLGWTLRTIFLPACIVLVLVTSSGAYAFILKEFGKLTNDSEKEKIVLQINQDEKQKLEARKNSLEEQVAQLPSNFVRQRANLMNTFQPELDSINSRLEVLNNEIKEAKTSKFNSSNESTNSTIASISKVYNLPPDQVNRILAFFITFMIDPLAIALLTLANFLSSLRKKNIESAKINEYVTKTRAEKIKELMFGKNIPIDYPEVKVSFQDISDNDVSKINLPIKNYIKSCKLVDNTIVDKGLSPIHTSELIKESELLEDPVESLVIKNFVISCKLKENEDSLFEEPLISSFKLKAIKLFSDTSETSANESNNQPQVAPSSTNSTLLQNDSEITEELFSASESLVNNPSVSAHNVQSESLLDDNSPIHLQEMKDVNLFDNDFSTTVEVLNPDHIVNVADDELDNIGFSLSDLTSPLLNQDEFVKDTHASTSNTFSSLKTSTRTNLEHLWIDDPEVRKEYEKENEGFYLNN